MMQRLVHRLRRLREDNSGVAVLELALAAPILALMMIGVADLSNAYSRKLQLEQAAQRSIEKIMQTTAETTPDATLQAEAVAQAGMGLTTSDVTVTYSLYCDMVKAASADGNCDPGKKESRYIEVTVVDDYTPMFPLHFAPITADGKYIIRAVAGMRTQ
jgi:Flp pilus assembly protein TadG